MSIDIWIEAQSQEANRESRLLRVAGVFLILHSLVLSLAPLARLETWNWTDLRWQHWISLPIWGLCVWLIRRSAGRVCPQRDPFLIPLGFVLIGWGNLAIWRLSPAFGLRQSLWMLVASAAIVEFFRAPMDLLWLRRYRYLWLASGLVLTSLTLIWGTNPSGGAQRLWLGCCGIYLQPSEPLRLFLIVFMASFLADRMALTWKGKRAEILPALTPLLLAWGLSVALLFVQRDLGTATLLLTLLAVLLFLATERGVLLVLAAGMIFLGGALGSNLIQVVRVRMETWINPWLDSVGAGYQLVQSLIAIASGGILGRGPGLGSPGFVPVAHSDFIYSAIVEEGGLAAGLAMIGLFALLVGRGMRIAARQRDPFASLLAAGISITFGLQSIFIMGGILRLIPLTGVTLPFVSYGGSSLLTSVIGLGLLLALSARQEPHIPETRSMRLSLGGLLSGFIALSFLLGWWVLIRGEDLIIRPDNPRLAFSARYSRLGQILDHEGRVLAESSGEVGAYQRQYPFGSSSGVVGYRSALYGLAGVEQAFDPLLRGFQNPDALGRAWQRLLVGWPEHGGAVRLSIDQPMQSQAIAALQDRPGAVVVLELENAEIRVSASAPNFDPNFLDQEWPALIERLDAPLLHRPTQGRYEPGTVLGPFVLAWGYQEQLVSNLSLEVSAREPLVLEGGGELSCAQPLSSASFNLIRSFQAACPRPFAELGDRIGSQGLRSMLETFGFTEIPSLGIESGAELVLGDFEDPRLAAVGQSGLTVSPIQIARAFSTLLLDGRRVMPQLVLAVDPGGSGDWQEARSPSASRQVISPNVAASVRAMLLSEDGSYRYTGLALAGDDDLNTIWQFIADERLLVLVVLEQGDIREAQAIGEMIYQSYQP